MWKCATKSLGLTLKKSVLKCTTVLSTCSQEQKDVSQFLRTTPVLLHQWNRFFNKYKGNCENFTKERKDKGGENEKKTSFLGGLESYFVDALSWTGALVLVGYYAVYYDRKRFFQYNGSQACPFKSLEYFILRGTPYNCVLPEVQAAKTKVNNTTESNNCEEDRNFENAHRKVLGTLSCWLGTQCMESGHHKEALEYFFQSAEEGYAPGIFNLGICHEKGLGTSQNLTKAAELYQKAADLGHATAMYNLGVFYARGWGGIQPDVNHARELFETAANLGQTDAVKALKLENKFEEKSKDSSSSKTNIINALSQLIFDNLVERSSPKPLKHLHNQRINDSCQFSDEEVSEHDSGALDLSPQTEPCTLLL